MQAENKTCQNCKQDFVIDPEDFEFYEKIKVPAPTWCPQCRLQRRLGWANIFNLYKRKCDLCLEEKIVIYPEGIPYKVFCSQCWWGDNWDPYEYGMDYDFSKPFFEQFNDLLHRAPLEGLSIDLEVSSKCPYNNYAGWLKNCYMVFFGDFNEDCICDFYLSKSKSILNSAIISKSQYIYDSININNVNNGIGLVNVDDSFDSCFLKDSVNCQSCFASANLRNKKYVIFNQQYSKEEYLKEIKKWDMGSYKTYQEAKKMAEEHWKKLIPRPRFEQFSVNSTGQFVYKSRNCKECYQVDGAENSKYVMMTYIPPVRDCYDYTGWGNNVSMIYESCAVGESANNVRFTSCGGLNQYNVEYCRDVSGGSNLFGCVSMRKGEYCILNKKYEKNEFEELRKRIIKHMNDMPYVDSKGRIYKYGEFPPIEFSTHAYNETLANDFFPMGKDEAINKNYKWRDVDKRDYVITKKTEDVPDHIKDTQDDIVNEIIQCSTCARGFRIVTNELNLLRQMNLPLPRQCPFCRIKDKFNQWIKSLNLVTRYCYKCNKEFKTQYTEHEYPNILCKECYLNEVI